MESYTYKMLWKGICMALAVINMSFRIATALVAFLLNIVPLSLAVNLGIGIGVIQTNQDCFDHRIGLTNTSILVEYRIVNTTSSPTSVGEWRYLADAIPPSNVQAQLHDSAEGGFQLRLLQLEHGGGGCNCWSVNSINVDFGVSMVTMCTNQGLINNNIKLFCMDYASRARGMITEVYCSVSNNSEPCPGESETLIQNKGPSVCEASNFRM